MLFRSRFDRRWVQCPHRPQGGDEIGDNGGVADLAGGAEGGIDEGAALQVPDPGGALALGLELEALLVGPDDRRHGDRQGEPAQGRGLLPIADVERPAQEGLRLGGVEVHPLAPADIRAQEVAGLVEGRHRQWEEPRPRIGPGRAHQADDDNNIKTGMYIPSFFSSKKLHTLENSLILILAIIYESQ